MLGAGGQTVWIDPALDAVVVLRWLDPVHAPQAIGLLAAALAEHRRRSSKGKQPEASNP